MLNSCEFIGNLGADPEIRSFQSGGRVCNLRLAVTEKWKKDGQPQERTDWISIAVFQEGLVGVAEKYLRKGSKLYVRGQWRTRKYQAQDGSDRYSTECVLQGPDSKIVMLDGPPQTGERKASYGDGSQGATADSGPFGSDLDDDIPFITNAGIY